MGEMNSEIISRFHVAPPPPPIRTWLALKMAHRRRCGVFRILFLDQCYPMETEALKFSIASWKDFPYLSSKFRLSNLMSSQKASNIQIFNLEHFHVPITQICNNVQACSLPFFVTPINLVLITGKKSTVFFILSEIIDSEEIENFLPFKTSFTLH